MSDLQDTLRQIMSNPEAMRQVQSLGDEAPPPSPPPVQPPAPPPAGGEMMTALSKLAPLMSVSQPNDETAALLNALRPFLSGEKLERLNSAQRLIRLIRMIPLLRDSGLFL